jgi:YaiO family outer membrane protein
VVLKQVLDAKPANLEAWEALIDLEIWSDQPKTAIDDCNIALKNIPNAESILYKKARAQRNNNEPDAAYETISQLLKLYPKNSEARALAEAIQRDARKNAVSVTYDYDEFSQTNRQFAPWNNVALAYSRKTHALGSVIGRYTYGNRFENEAHLLELDMYPRLGEKMYAYVSGGMGFHHDSQSTIIDTFGVFPRYRFGLSVYRSLPHAFEVELGVRYLQFKTATIIYTGSIGKYYGNFWFSLRTYLTPGDSLGLSKSVNFITRYYFNGNADDYINLTVGYGLSPDERVYDKQKEIHESKKIRLGLQKMLFKSYIFNISGGMAWDATFFGTRRDASVSVGIQKFF